MAACTILNRLNSGRSRQRQCLTSFFHTFIQPKPQRRAAFGRTVHYTINQWKYLERYLLDARLEISNNRAEPRLARTYSAS
ncbi:IS66 family transposase [Pelorhabdus rhamnosifermentans]|uniref:IS66 family transposase n=1 Tax=Pelorhabdus rhamnosifermentans TaxID=2772457 RepID=UPI0035E43947